MRRERPRVVFFDAFGTLVTLDRPFERLRDALADRGHVVPLPDVEAALRREFAHYIAHSLQGRDPASLRALRQDCAAVLLEGFRERGYPLPLGTDEGVDLLMSAIRFVPFPDVRPALERLASAGVRLGMISNWDCSLPQVMQEVGIAPFLECITVSATSGREKPDPAIFHEALRCAGVSAAEALHVGDSYEKDYLGARAAGLQAVLLLREAGRAAPPGVPVARTLAELL